ncbi:MAG: GNAT family N-acetyltransferase [bacterium]|nr:GNAT family N-acetyltransferase [bacterium]MCP5066882.1 GNAT family N-acetyltransferase [bacterium]
MNAEMGAIERAAFDAWPAAEVQELGSWRLRFNHGVTNRGNSVWPGGPECPDVREIDENLDAAEGFYRERGCPALFQLTPLAQPGSLDSRLETRGYQRVSPVHVQSAEALPVAELPIRTALHTGCDDQPSPAWIDLATHRGRYSGTQADIFLAMLEKLGGRAGFGWAGEGDEIAATGMVVAAPPWAGIFAMRTQEIARGQGLGRSVLVALARWATSRGARHLYLQVEQDNAPAQSLYQRAGFELRYPYHYRRAP